MPTYSPNMKLCATCERCAGVRDVNATRSCMSTASSITGGGHNYAQTPASGTCSQHRKWSVLR